jgi:hypothetical protein
MAYNVLKGIVSGSVDQYGDQEIGGVKVFKNTISASVFYDTDAQSPCATLKDVALLEIAGARSGGVLTYDRDKKAVANFDLIFDANNKVLQTQTIRAKSITGSAGGLRDLPTDRFSGVLAADVLNIGHGLHSVRGALQVKSGPGLKSTKEGATINVHVNGGLSLRSKKVLVDPNNCASINTDGQNLSDKDLLLVFDESRGYTFNTTLGNFYSSYIRSKMPLPSGKPGDIQFRTKGGFGSSANISYGERENVLNIGGRLSTNLLKVGHTAEFQGAIVQNIVTVTAETYDVQKDDYTILGDSTENSIDIILPPACNHPGRVVVIKKINKEKYSLKTHPLNIIVNEGAIDYKEVETLKYNYSSRTVQSDGETWWFIGKSGS